MFASSCAAGCVLGACIAPSAMALFGAAAEVRPSDEQLVVRATIAAVRGLREPLGPKPTVIAMSIVNGYALASWNAGDGGGSTALRKHGARWSVIISGGGMVDRAALVRFHVPPKIAARLFSTLTPWRAR